MQYAHEQGAAAKGTQSATAGDDQYNTRSCTDDALEKHMLNTVDFAITPWCRFGEDMYLRVSKLHEAPLISHGCFARAVSRHDGDFVADMDICTYMYLRLFAFGGPL